MKKSLSLLISLFSSCVLLGCGGGNSTPTPPPSSPAIAVALTPNSAQALDANQSFPITANVSNDSGNQGINWIVVCPAGINACGAMAQTSTASGAANKFNASGNVTAAEIVTVRATSVSDPSKFQSVQVTVNPALALVSPMPAQPQPGTAGLPFSLNLMTFVQGGTQPFAWSIKSGTLPVGLTLNANTGTVTGTPSSAVTAAIVAFNCTDAGNPPTALPASFEISFTINPAGALTITSGTPPSGTVGETYGGTNSLTVDGTTGNYSGWPLTATGGAPGYQWSWSPAQGSSLPPGLTVTVRVLRLVVGAGNRCCVVVVEHVPVIGGTPIAAGTYKVIVTVTDSGSPAAKASANYTITIAPPPPPIINAIPAPSAGAINLPYSFAFTVASGGQPPFTWSETGMLPAGLVLNNDGVLSGTPTALGSSPITVMVQDAVGQNSAPQDFTIQIYAHGFKATDSMGTAREFHTATLLDFGSALTNGKVLVAGGGAATAELFDSGSGTFTPTGSMATPRNGHTATLLKDGKVLVAGGLDSNNQPLASAELFDPSTGKFTPTGSMEIARWLHTATLLADGRVLITGGAGSDGHSLMTAEIYDSASFTPTGNMLTARSEHTATLLSDGKVLVAGGRDVSGDFNTAEIFDPTPTHGSFAPTGSMATARAEHTATLLAGGKVLLAGGDTAAAELFDGGFSPVGDMETARFQHTATLRNDGTVLIAGGSINVKVNGRPSPRSLAAAELFDPVSKTFMPTGSMETPRSGHTATLLKDGSVLVTGGFDASGTPLATAELYQ